MSMGNWGENGNFARAGWTPHPPLHGPPSPLCSASAAGEGLWIAPTAWRESLVADRRGRGLPGTLASLYLQQVVQDALVVDEKKRRYSFCVSFKLYFALCSPFSFAHQKTNQVKQFRGKPQEPQYSFCFPWSVGRTLFLLTKQSQKAISGLRTSAKSN